MSVQPSAAPPPGVLVADDGYISLLLRLTRPKLMREFYLVPLRTGAWGSDHPDAVIAVDQLPCVVGRHPGCDRRVHHPRVSRRHCAFWLRDGRACLPPVSRSREAKCGTPVGSADTCRTGRVVTKGLAGRAGSSQEFGPALK